MLRTKIVAVLLTVAVLLCVPVFSASAEEDTCNISVSINGYGTVTMNGAESYDALQEDYLEGETVTMVAEPDEDNEFLFWISCETNRVISWDPTFTFDVVTDARFEAVFDDLESIMDAEGKHTIIYLTIGENLILMRQGVDLGSTAFLSAVPTTGMKLSGRNWTGWDKTNDEIASTPGRVYVHPKYDTDATFTVTWTADGVTETRDDVEYLSKIKVTAPDAVNNTLFSYWLALPKAVNDDPVIASFYPAYEFIVTGNVELLAVYGESVDKGVCARIAGDLPSFSEGALSIFAEHSVLSYNNTVLEHGMLITKDQHIGSFENEFVINDSEKKIIRSKNFDMTYVGSHRVHISNWYSVNMGSYTYYPVIYARAYVITRNQNGVTSTTYSDIYCVNYNYDSGYSGGDNYDDPLG